jgi:hypothetical protein
MADRQYLCSADGRGAKCAYGDIEFAAGRKRNQSELKREI